MSSPKSIPSTESSLGGTSAREASNRSREQSVEHAFNPADKARRSFASHVVARPRRAILATSWLHRRKNWPCDALVQRLPKPKVAGSRPVVRFPRVARTCTDSQGLAAGFGLLKRRTASAAEGQVAWVGVSVVGPRNGSRRSWLHLGYIRNHTRYSSQIPCAGNEGVPGSGSGVGFSRTPVKAGSRCGARLRMSSSAWWATDWATRVCSRRVFPAGMPAAGGSSDRRVPACSLTPYGTHGSRPGHRHREHPRGAGGGRG